MTFAKPEFLFLLLLLIPFVFMAIFNFKKKKKLLASLLSITAYKKLGVRSGREINIFKTLLLIAAIIFFMLALAGPQWGEVYEQMEIKGIETIFIMDTSSSMDAEDLKPSRLEVAKQLVLAIVDNLKTDYIGLINFAGIPYVQCPLTMDYSAFIIMTEASVISPSEEQGTDFGSAFELALKSFESSKSSERVMVLITDGEDQEKQWHKVVELLKEKKIIVFTVGVGIKTGAPIPIKDKNGRITGWKKDKSGNIVKTRLDEDNLIRIASATGGQYFRLTDPVGIDAFVENLKSFEKSIIAKKVKLKKIARFQYPLIIGLFFLLLEMVLSERKISWRRE